MSIYAVMSHGFYELPEIIGDMLVSVFKPIQCRATADCREDAVERMVGFVSDMIMHSAKSVVVKSFNSADADAGVACISYEADNPDVDFDDFFKYIRSGAHDQLSLKFEASSPIVIAVVKIGD